jgi:uncharacterized protein YyaL (SSP411 family)
MRYEAGVRAVLLILLVACRPSAPQFRFSPRPNRAREIHWRAWGPEIFRDGRPIFLSLSAIWCHWCHVLDETSLSDPRIISRLNEDFVPVRVDADQHPEVERRYILGGWPTVAVLTRDGEIVDGGTYVPPDELLRMLDDSLAALHGPELAQKLARFQHPTPPTPAPIPPDAVENVTRLLSGAIDPQYGGFGHGAKFPQADAVELLLDVGERALAKQTLDAMLALEDPVEGGFYRYATRSDWSHPHYEKMLAVNADLIALYAKAAKLLGEPKYAAAAKRASDYVKKNLFDERTGDLWASQDADENYYTVERKQPPYIDRTLLVDRAAMMIYAWEALGENQLAKKAAARILKLQQTDGLFRHGEGLRPQVADQAYAARALISIDEAAARRAMAAAEKRWTAPSGALFDGDELPEGRLKYREQPLVENSVFARVAKNKKILEAFAGSYLKFGTEAATWALAVRDSTSDR